MSDLREIIVVKSVCRKFFFHSNFGLSLKERNFEDIVIFHRPKRWKSTTNSIPVVPTFRLFPSWKRKRRNYHHFQSLSLSLFVRSRGTHARSFISCFNFRSTRVTLDRPRKLLTPGGWLEEDGKENRGHPPKTPHRLVPNERAEPDVHLIIITPNESHSLTVPSFPTFVMDFCGQLRQSPPPPSFHFRLHASAFCCTLSNRCYDSSKTVPPLPANKSWNIYEVGETGPTLFLSFFLSFFSSITEEWWDRPRVEEGWRCYGKIDDRDWWLVGRRGCLNRERESRVWLSCINKDSVYSSVSFLFSFYRDRMWIRVQFEGREEI